jgi:hypothetical protein
MPIPSSFPISFSLQSTNFYALVNISFLQCFRNIVSNQSQGIEKPFAEKHLQTMQGSVNRLSVDSVAILDFIEELARFDHMIAQPSDPVFPLDC